MPVLYAAFAEERAQEELALHAPRTAPGCLNVRLRRLNIHFEKPRLSIRLVFAVFKYPF